MKLPVLSVQTESSSKSKRKRNGRDNLTKEKRSLSQMLNIIEYPRSKKSYYRDRLAKGRASVIP